MTHRRSNNAAIAAWQGTAFTPVSAQPDHASEATGPSDIETMVSRFFPLGRLRLAQVEPDGPDHAPDARAGSAGGAYGALSRIATFPGREAARGRRLMPAGQSRGAVLLGTRGNAIPARRVWDIPDLS